MFEVLTAKSEKKQESYPITLQFCCLVVAFALYFESDADSFPQDLQICDTGSSY